MPYLYPAERIVVSAYGSHFRGTRTDPDDWYLDFLAQPANYLRARGVQEVYFVRGDDGPESPMMRDILPIGPFSKMSEEREYSKSDVLTVTVQGDERHRLQNCKSAEENVDGDSLFGSCSLMSSRSALSADCWFFLLFNKELNYQQQQFLQRFTLIAAGRTLVEALHDSRLVSQIKGVYRQLVGTDDLNASSLAILSGCRMTQGQDFDFSPFCDADLCPCLSILGHDPSWARLRRHLQRTACLGLVYTGDLPAKNVWSELSRKFGLSPSAPDTATVLYQVPHHGSWRNWHAAQSQIPIAPAYVISAGRHNRHRHPNARVLYDIVQSRRRPIWVSDDGSFSHTLRIGI